MKYRSTLFDEAANKIGTIVAAKNRNGNYFRNLVIPHNPKSAKQTSVRASFSTNSQAWRALTEVQRAGWVSLAATVTLHDTLGNKYAPTGQQLYVSCNGNLAACGQAPISTAPASAGGAPDVTITELVATVETATPHTQTLTVDLAGGVDTDFVLIYATPLFSAGRNFVGPSQYRIISIQQFAGATPVDSIDDYQAEFGNLAVGSKLSVKIKSVSASGFAALPVRQDIIVSAV